MVKKQIILSCLLAWSFFPGISGQNNYCIPEGVYNKITNAKWLTEKPRFFRTISIDGAHFEGSAAPFSQKINDGNTRTPNVYYNMTDKVINASLGDQLKIRWEKSADLTWMHYYAYIDYNGDGTFDEQTEAVSWSYFKGKDSQGKSCNESDDVFELPAFTIPENAKTGSTRIRIKCDWDCKNPCENTDPNNYMYMNGGSIIDFTINITAPVKKEQHLVNLIQEGKWGSLYLEGYNAITNSGGVLIDEGTTLNIVARPDPCEEAWLESFSVNNTDCTNQLNNYVFQTTVSEPLEVRAAFAVHTYSVRFNLEGEAELGLYDELTGKQYLPGESVPQNTLLYWTITPAKGYTLKTVKENGNPIEQSQLNEGRYALGRISQDYVYDIVLSNQGSGLTENVGSGLSVNCQKDLLTVEGLNKEETATVINAAGVAVKTVKSRITNLSELPDGCYLLQITRNDAIYNLKFIKN